jgi:hypothetical protein
LAVRARWAVVFGSLFHLAIVENFCGYALDRRLWQLSVGIIVVDTSHESLVVLCRMHSECIFPLHVLTIHPLAFLSIWSTLANFNRLNSMRAADVSAKIASSGESALKAFS